MKKDAPSSPKPSTARTLFSNIRIVQIRVSPGYIGIHNKLIAFNPKRQQTIHQQAQTADHPAKEEPVPSLDPSQPSSSVPRPR